MQKKELLKYESKHNFVVDISSYTSQEEIDRICQGVLENLYAPDKTNECMNQLRQLYFILQASHTELW